MNEQKRAFAKYVNSAADLAESVRDDINEYNGYISDNTVKKLAGFISAAHAIEGFLTNVMDDDKGNLQ
jgi:hypothetical protein